MKINIKSILKTLSAHSLLAVSILALVSCSDIDIQRNEASDALVQNEDSSKTAKLRISLGKSSRTIDPDIDISDLKDFELTGSWVNGKESTENQSIYTWKDYNAFTFDPVISVKNGNWTFTLTAKKDRTVYSAVAETAVRLNTGNAVYFSLKRDSQPEDGTGTLNLTLKWDPTDEDFRNPKKVKVTIKKDDEAETAVSTDTISVTEYGQIVINKSLPKGSYIMNADLYAEDGERDLYLTTWSELVNIATDHTSSAERYVSFNSVRKIYWELRDEGESEWKPGTLIPQSFSQKEGVDLPDTSCLTREGYFFYGWTDEYWNENYITEIAPGNNDKYIYACWGKINPVPTDNGIKLDLILPENTYDIELYRTEDESGESFLVWEYRGDSQNPLSETTLSLTDRFTEQGKTYYYYFNYSCIENDCACSGYSYSDSQTKKVTAVNATRIPQVTSVPNNITADIMNDTLVYSGTVSYKNFFSIEGYAQKTAVVYKDAEENSGIVSFDLTEKSFRKLITDYNWKNYEIKPDAIQLYYVSDDGTSFWYIPQDTSFNGYFPSFRISATQDHTILSVEKTERGHELTVFVPAGTKKVDLGFCTIGDEQSAITQTDTTVTVLNKYETPDYGNSTRYQVYYTDSSSKVTQGCSTSWIGALEESSCLSRPELTSNISAHFDEEVNGILLDELPQVDFKGQEPDDWGIDLVYYFGGNSNYRIAARYTDGNAISVPLEFSQDSDAVHAQFKRDSGTYDFYRSYGYIRIPAEQNDSTMDGVNYTVQFNNDCFDPDYFEMHKKYTVTFDPDNGSAVTTQKVNRTYYAQEPETEPSKTNYIFGGWALEGEAGRFDFYNTPVESDITLKALWLTDAVPSYSVIVTMDQGEMPMEYTTDEEKKEIRFRFPYYAYIYVNGEMVTERWYNWTFEYENLPKGYYTIDFVEPNEWSALPGERFIDYSYTLHVQVK